MHFNVAARCTIAFSSSDKLCSAGSTRRSTCHLDVRNLSVEGLTVTSTGMSSPNTSAEVQVRTALCTVAFLSSELQRWQCPPQHLQMKNLLLRFAKHLVTSTDVFVARLYAEFTSTAVLGSAASSSSDKLCRAGSTLCSICNRTSCYVTSKDAWEAKLYVEF